MEAYKRLFSVGGVQYQAAVRQAGSCATIVIGCDDPAVPDVEYVVLDDVDGGALASGDIGAIEAAVAFAIEDALNAPAERRSCRVLRCCPAYRPGADE